MTKEANVTKRRYVLGLGSNERARENFAAMIEALLQECGDLCVSPVCRTPPSHGEGPEYLNAVVSLESPLALPDFRALCKSIEAHLGRIRPSQTCVADIDILAVWERPEKTRAEEFVVEYYLQPMADEVLKYLELYSGEERETCEELSCVSVELTDKRVVGLRTMELSNIWQPNI